ncbi:MAG: DUF3592 domain-containing protein [Oscillospiraceae bacterium]|nr:DUF3592 domain-containing protein [Oscillospiraceae bacterium]
MKFNFKKAVIIILFASALLVGAVLLFFGIKESVAIAIKTKDWFDAPGYFRDYSIYNVNSDGETTYRLKYVYYAGGAEYFIETDYGSEIIPEIDSVRTVLYEPENPENAVLKGGNSSAVYLYMGVLFTFAPIFMIICWLFVTGKTKLNVKTLDFTAGLILFVVGELAIYLMGGSLWIGNALKAMGIVVLIPGLMVAVGILQMIKTVFVSVKEKK